MSSPEPNTATLMFIAFRYMEQAVLDRLAATGFADLTLAQARVLQRIADDGIRLTSLAEQAQVTKQSAGFLVDQLEKTGYVERVPDPADARARLIRVAGRGEGAVRVSAQVVAEVEKGWEQHVGKTRLAMLRKTLLALREVTDPHA